MNRQNRYMKDVVSLDFNRDRCTGCGMCSIVCPHGVFVEDNGTATIDDRDACMECGACARNCPTGSITVKTGVGCAMAVINSALGREASSCCCVIDTPENESPDTPSCCG